MVEVGGPYLLDQHDRDELPRRGTQESSESHTYPALPRRMSPSNDWYPPRGGTGRM